MKYLIVQIRFVRTIEEHALYLYRLLGSLVENACRR